MVASDTDSTQDIYQRSNGVTTLISTESSGGNGPFNIVFDRITPDGSKVFFDPYESLVSGDADSSRDIYERSNGATTEISMGPIGGNGAFAIVGLEPVRVFDGGADGLAATPDNTLFADQGLFVP